MGVDQKMRPSHPLEVLNSFVGKFILGVAKGTKFSRNLISHEYNNWWKFINL